MLIQRCTHFDIWWRRQSTYFQHCYNVVKFDVKFLNCLNAESTSRKKDTNFVLNVHTQFKISCFNIQFNDFIILCSSVWLCMPVLANDLKSISTFFQIWCCFNINIRRCFNVEIWRQFNHKIKYVSASFPCWKSTLHQCCSNVDMPAGLM